MHEASIALSVIEIAEDHCKQAGGKSIQSISLTIGSASGVLYEALLTAFDIVKAETMASEAKLLVTRIQLGGTCQSCNKTFQTEERFILKCPHCESGKFRLDRGRELDINEIEVEE